MSTVRRAAALVAVIVLTGCSGSSSPESGEPRSVDRRPIRSYVALGDSFVAGPGIADVRNGSGFCFQSDHNWPSLLARSLDVGSFTDVSCIGAATRDILAERAIPGAVVRAQLAAVKKHTDLVTVGIGGNDGDLFTSLLSACTQQADVCGSFADDTAPAILKTTVPDVVDVLDRIRDEAPDATILLVGYLRVLPDSGTCSAIGIPADDVGRGSDAEQELDRALAEAARRAGVDFVSMRKASRGHDVCAGADAWVNGATADGHDGVAFHPRLAGMRAVAEHVLAAITES